MTHGSVRVPALARVEGEGGLEVVVRDGEVVEARLDIYEPPRFFEALLRGRRYTEPPDITARICGICPIAYQMSSAQAIEDACGASVEGAIRALRRLIYFGEWIESHALHIYLLHAPDFLGYESGIHLARDHADIVQRGLRIKRIGNRLMDVVGGRSVHPINVRVGGFYSSPRPADLQALLPELRWALDASIETVRWVAGFEFPDFSHDYRFVSLRHPTEYPILDGRIVSNGGLDIPVQEYEEHFEEEHVEHSNALHSRMTDGSVYFVGPMARYSLNADRLGAAAADAAREAGLGPAVTNPFRSIVVRAVELVEAVDGAIRIIEGYEPADPPFVDVQPREGVGMGISEAPRGILFHRYAIGDDGLIRDAKIVPPTSQNQKVIEDDLRRFVQDRIELDTERLTWECEQAVRNYDPCISCATHFLDLRVDRA